MFRTLKATVPGRPTSTVFGVTENSTSEIVTVCCGEALPAGEEVDLAPPPQPASARQAPIRTAILRMPSGQYERRVGPVCPCDHRSRGSLAPPAGDRATAGDGLGCPPGPDRLADG